jgi:hypothetical protein
VPEIILVAVATIGLLLFRHYAARQVAARRGRFVWAFAFPMVLGPAVALWAGFRLVLATQLWGVLLILFGVALGLVELQFFRRASRAVSNASAEQDLGEALVEPATDFAIVMTVGGLIVAIVGGLGLVVWAVLTQGR